MSVFIHACLRTHRWTRPLADKSYLWWNVEEGWEETTYKAALYLHMFLYCFIFVLQLACVAFYN